LPVLLLIKQAIKNYFSCNIYKDSLLLNFLMVGNIGIFAIIFQSESYLEYYDKLICNSIFAFENCFVSEITTTWSTTNGNLPWQLFIFKTLPVLVQWDYTFGGWFCQSRETEWPEIFWEFSLVILAGRGSNSALIF